MFSFTHIIYKVQLVDKGYDTLPNPKLDTRWALAFKRMELWGLGGTFPTFSTKRGRRAC
jgi:hypothetical protein